MLLLLLLLGAVQASLLPTPLMGWSTWESFAKDLSRDKILANARVLQTSGLFAKGYKMIQIDDGWMQYDLETRWASREGGYEKTPPNANKNKLANKKVLKSQGPVGCLMADLKKFPHGIKAHGDELHSMGFKFGLYTSGERLFCDPVSNPFYASSEFMDLRERDAECFREWQVDLMKIDFCQPQSRKESYVKATLKFWRKALGPKVILYNSRYLCMAPTTCRQTTLCPMLTNIKANSKLPQFCSRYSQLARTGPDVKPNWGSILAAISTRFGRGQVSKPGFWSDPDYLLPHPTELSFEERRSQFAMWCVTSSPLLISTDLTTVDRATLEMLGNDEAIEINQMYLKDAGDLYEKTKNDLWVFRKRMGTYFAVAIVNVGRDLNTFELTKGGSTRQWIPNFNKDAFHTGVGGKLRATRCKYRNVFTGEEGVLLPETRIWIEERDSVLLKVFDCIAESQAVAS